MPGVIDTKNNVVEHPELVAERIERFAGLVGRENVIPGTDCGFGTFAGFGGGVSKGRLDEARGPRPGSYVGERAPVVVVPRNGAAHRRRPVCLGQT